jgi:NAD(P)-dependent dehydrogenase (short-subunit alcohol dehydrogenase family)
MAGCDILVSGTGSFAARIVFDIAATAAEPISVTIAGRNRARLQWLQTAANARAAIFGRPARFETHRVDLLEPDAAPRLLAAIRPRILVQAASIQTSSVIAQSDNAWARLVARGGLSATAVFQALITSRMAAAISQSGEPIILVNCSFPDVVNGLITAMGHEVACGMGNIAILSNVMVGSGVASAGAEIKLLAHYQNLAAWRRPPAERCGVPPRVWIDGVEMDDVFDQFAAVQLTPEPVIDISGASGVPMLLAMSANREWSGHVPGPAGLPGGYPVTLSNGKIALSLPENLGRDLAITWNAGFERENGLTVSPDGKVSYTGALKECLVEHAADLAEGFHVGDIEDVCRQMLGLRAKLMAVP